MKSTITFVVYHIYTGHVNVTVTRKDADGSFRFFVYDHVSSNRLLLMASTLNKSGCYNAKTIRAGEGILIPGKVCMVRWKLVD